MNHSLQQNPQLARIVLVAFVFSNEYTMRKISLGVKQVLRQAALETAVYPFYYADPGPDGLNLLNYSLQQNPQLPRNVLVEH